MLSFESVYKKITFSYIIKNLESFLDMKKVIKRKIGHLMSEWSILEKRLVKNS